MTDRYTKFALSLIAAALVYLCVIFTPLPGAHAQTPSIRPGEPSGPTEVIVVGWQAPGGIAVPVSITHPVQVTAPQPLRVTGQVITESSDRAGRVVVIGWEENAVRDRARDLKTLSDSPNVMRGLPVQPPK